MQTFQIADKSLAQSQGFTLEWQKTITEICYV